MSMPSLRRAGAVTATAGSLFVLILVAGVAGSHAAPPTTQPAASAPTTAPKPFADEIRRFTEWDRKNSFPKDAVLFVGSSSARMWPTHESFPQWPVINRAFGGSKVAEVNHYFDQVVAPYHARVIVLYCGDNDVASGVTPEQVRDDFVAFVKRVRLTQPDTPIIYLSIKASGSRMKFWPAAQAANKLVREVCAAQPHLTFVDVATPLLGDNGQPRDELFLPDRLHLNEAGYAVWTRILTPVLEPLLAAH